MENVPSTWTSGLATESAFWDRVVSGLDARWKEGFDKRFEVRDLHDGHRALAERSAQGAMDVSVLDVGAGPCTVFGCRWPGRRLTVVAVDPLADEYAEQLGRSGRLPPVLTIKGCAESLLEQFGPSRFDLVFSHNALDHSYDPVLGIQQMIAVAKPRACIQLEHQVNEGEGEKYRGLHQWNFCEQNGDFLIWNKTRSQNVNQLLASTHAVHCKTKGTWLSITIAPRG